MARTITVGLTDGTRDYVETSGQYIATERNTGDWLRVIRGQVYMGNGDQGLLDAVDMTHSRMMRPSLALRYPATLDGFAAAARQYFGITWGRIAPLKERM